MAPTARCPCSGPLTPIEPGPTGHSSPPPNRWVSPVLRTSTATPAQHPGFGPTPKNVAGGIRMNAAFTYLTPARRPQPNLSTLIAERSSIRISSRTARRQACAPRTGGSCARGEVVLCAGAYGSPAIVSLRHRTSATCGSWASPSLSTAPGVGAHLLDHPLLLVDGAAIAAYWVKPEGTGHTPVFFPPIGQGPQPTSGAGDRPPRLPRPGPR